MIITISLVNIYRPIEIQNKRNGKNFFLVMRTQIFSSGQLSHITAAAGKSLQLCPTLCNPIDSSPPGSAIPGILQARILEWVAVSFSNA